MTKLKKLPKRPKASASVATKENWLKKANDVRKHNSHILSEKEKSARLTKKIADSASIGAVGRRRK